MEAPIFPGVGGSGTDATVPQDMAPPYPTEVINEEKLDITADERTDGEQHMAETGDQDVDDL